MILKLGERGFPRAYVGKQAAGTAGQSRNPRRDGQTGTEKVGEAAIHKDGPWGHLNMQFSRAFLLAYLVIPATLGSQSQMSEVQPQEP